MSIDLTLYALGDLGPRRSDPHSIFDQCRSTLKQADLVFAQLEPCLSNRGTPAPQARLAMRTDPVAAQAIKAAGIDVVSWASNHCMDWGRDAFADTLHNLAENKIAMVGAGQTIQLARQPYIKIINDNRIAMLAYCSILPQGYWATEDCPGCAPMRAVTVNEQIEHDQPGTPMRQHTFPQREDMLALLADIQSVKKQADVVLVSFHWGLHFIPVQIADYQQQIAHAAIDAGADIIVGHHPHILKGIEIYRDAPIFYSLGNFAIESPSAFKAGLQESDSFHEIKSLNKNWLQKDRLLLPVDSLKTCIAKFELSAGKVQRVGLIPCYINEDAQPEVLNNKDDKFLEVVSYLQQITEAAQLNARLQVIDNEVWVTC